MNENVPALPGVPVTGIGFGCSPDGGRETSIPLQSGKQPGESSKNQETLPVAVSDSIVSAIGKPDVIGIGTKSDDGADVLHVA